MKSLKNKRGYLVSCLIMFALTFNATAQNVGINQPIPLWPLDVKGPHGVIRLVTTMSNFGSTLELKNDNASAEYMGVINFNNSVNSYPGQIAYQSNHNLTFRTNFFEKMRITPEGWVGIGTTTPAHALDVSEANATLRLRAYNNGDGANIYLANDNSSGNMGNIYFVNHEGFIKGYIAYIQNNTMAFYTNNSSRLRINGEGLIGIGTVPSTNSLEVSGNASKSVAGDWLANSDARLKKNIQPLNSHMMLDRLLMLEGISYEWDDTITGYTRPEGIQFGFIAQNIQQAFPTLVEEDNIGYYQTAYGTYDPMMVEAIRALDEKIKMLQIENRGLHSEIEDLHSENADLSKQIHEIMTTLNIKIEAVKQ